ARRLLERRPNLGARFVTTSLGRPVQVVCADTRIPVRRIDLADRTEAERSRAAEEAVREDRVRRFDLAAGPALRITDLRLGERSHRLLLTNHHILLDGWSMPLLVRELFQLYALERAADALPEGLGDPAPYRDYLEWLARWDRGAAEAAWRRAVEGVTEPTLLAPTAPETPAPTERLELELSAELAAELAALARRSDVSVNTLLQLAWAMLLSGVTGRSEVVFGTTVSGRPTDLPGVDSMIGLFINPLPVRVRLDPAEPVAEALRRIQAEQTALLDHHHLGLTEIQGRTGLGALFDTLLVFENYPFDPESAQLPQTGLELTGAVTADTTHYPLTAVALPGETLRFDLHYRPDALTTEQVRALADRLRATLERLPRSADLPLARVDLLTPEEAERVLVEWNATGVELPEQSWTVHGRLAELRARTPDAPALALGEDEWSFAELDDAAERLAHRLCAEGVGAEDVVAVLMDRSVELVVAVLAALKAGACYLPLDSRAPDERLESILGESAARVLLLDAAHTSRTLTHRARPLAVDASELRSAPPVAPLRTAVHPDQVAYTMYTSGSTGTPKGVAVTHRNIVELAADRCWRTGSQQRVLFHSTHAWDASTLEWWVPLLNGGQ